MKTNNETYNSIESNESMIKGVNFTFIDFGKIIKFFIDRAKKKHREKKRIATISRRKRIEVLCNIWCNSLTDKEKSKYGYNIHNYINAKVK